MAKERIAADVRANRSFRRLRKCSIRFVRLLEKSLAERLRNADRRLTLENTMPGVLRTTAREMPATENQSPEKTGHDDALLESDSGAPRTRIGVYNVARSRHDV